MKGDLGAIDAGDFTLTTLGLKSLNVDSMGRFSTGTGSDLRSDIQGPFGKLTVKADVAGAFIVVAGVEFGRIGSITIGGSLIGGDEDFSGAIASSGVMGPVKISRDLLGGARAKTRRCSAPTSESHRSRSAARSSAAPLKTLERSPAARWAR